MIARTIFFVLLLFALYAPALAQVDTAWVRRYDSPGNEEDYALDLALDDSGNVYVTGFSGIYPNYQYLTLKYSPGGELVWYKYYQELENGNDEAYALTVDNNQNLYVTGASFGGLSSYDYTTVKYAPNGDTVWVRRYNGPGNFVDAAYAIGVDQNGNVYVTGRSWATGTDYDYTTIKYSPEGDTLWVRRYDGPGSGEDRARDVKIDVNGNVYITGFSWNQFNPDYATVKYSPLGDTIWVRRYHYGAGNGTDEARALAVDKSGNVYVTGWSWGGGSTRGDYATIKYDPNGNTLWERRHSGSGNSADLAYDVEVDGNGKVYVTGGTLSLTHHMDFGTIKYSPLGDTLWLRSYDDADHQYDHAFKLALDTLGNVYVTGSSVKIGQYDDFLTVKYDSAGNLLWSVRYNGPVNSIDQPTALAVDDSGNFYVAGISDGGASSYDYTIIKYIPVECSAKSGDVDEDGDVDLSDIIFMVNSIFKAGPQPNPPCRGDANADGKMNLSDIVNLVNYLFKNGPPPQKFSVCCL